MMKLDRREVVAGLIAATALPGSRAEAQSAADTLTVVSPRSTNSLDAMAPGANGLSRMVAWQTYDRLVSHGEKPLEDGTISYDSRVLKPELAESWDLSKNAQAYTFHLRKNATFHDGTPVTAKDVKWSFDRAVAIGGLSAIQMAAGGMTRPDQFRVINDYLFQVVLDQPNKLTVADIAVPVAIIINSELAKKHATDSDPWAIDWISHNDAGGGAFKIESWTPDQELVLSRFDAWKSGPLPKLRRVILQQIAVLATRRDMLDRGEVDMAFGFSPKDYVELTTEGKVKVISVPMQNDLVFLDMNVRIAPFDNQKVREAISYAIPYKDILSSAVYDRARPMFDGDPNRPYDPTWPVPLKHGQDLDKAKQLLAAAGFSNGFPSSLSFNASRGIVGEATAALIQDSFKQIRVEITLDKVAGDDWFARMAAKTMPMVINEFYGWLDDPAYNFFWTYDGANNSVFNTANYANPKLDVLIDRARFTYDPDVHRACVQAMVDTVMSDLPRVPLYSRIAHYAMQKNVKGFEYWFHRYPDFRKLYKD
jgi:peptide/nickel transport system substrate-binding protein